jgi:[protein-PII] uridylyltransferase
MTLPSGLRSNIVAAKQRLAEGREKLKQRHLKGSPGIQVCRAETDLFDSFVLEIYESALRDLGQDRPDGLPSQIALVAHGGYGRGDVAPYSDVDLMILHEPAAASRLPPLVERMVRDIFDLGLILGQSVRTPKQAIDLAREDATICTSLIESRYLAGSLPLYTKFAKRFQNQVQKRANTFVSTIEQARAEERNQYGETVYLLEPNIKRSPGGLRDLQLMRWIGFARYKMAEPDGLRLQGILSRRDYEVVRAALEFLLRLRNEMHFHAGKSYDLLDRDEQLRIAKAFGFSGTEGLLPVEQFMREYFRLTNAVRNVAMRLVAGAKETSPARRFWAQLVSHQFERDYRVEPTQISANSRGLDKLRGNLTEILRLADIANLYNKPIAHATCEAIRISVPDLSDEMTPQSSQRFLSLLAQPARLGELLHDLHEMGVLEKVIPAFEHARSLLQFNAYHKYTVDEHCLRAVANVTAFRHDTGPLGKVYKHLKRKWMLHLALLIHDLGKGYVEDHSEIGLRIADETARRLGLSEPDGETLKFLVHKHLMMSHMAFRRDTSDNQLIVRFAFDVGSPEVLEMLFLLTAADLSAVGPGVLNAWKTEVLADLFHRTMQHLGGEDPTLGSEVRLAQRREEVLKLLGPRDDLLWFEKQVASLPDAYLEATPATEIANELGQLRQLEPLGVMVWGRYQPERNTIEYKIATYENVTPGVFHKLTGALTSRGLQILSAEIHTLAKGLVFDRFFVQDPDYAGEPRPERIEEVRKALEEALHSSDGKAPAFRRVWRPAEQRRTSNISPLPTQVRVDNSTSDRYTILDIFAADRMGLLYTITRTLFELGLSVSVAKIGTYLDQVVDAFYVTDQSGGKVENEAQLRDIRTRLLEAISELQRQDADPLRSW